MFWKRSLQSILTASRVNFPPNPMTMLWLGKKPSISTNSSYAEKCLSVVLTLVSPLWLASLNIHACLSACWDGAKLTAVIRVHREQSPCDKNTDDVTAMWHYKRVNMCRAVYSVMVSQVNSTRGKWYYFPDRGVKAQLSLCQESVFA